MGERVSGRMIPVIAVGFALLGGLLLWFVIGSRGRWPIKLGAIVVTCAFTFAAWHALDTFSGWPTEDDPPSRALVAASLVDEPEAIYLWLLPAERPGLLEYRADSREPRAYRLPYSKELHEQVDRASAHARRGQQVELRLETEGRGRQTRHVRRLYPMAHALPPKQASTTP